MHVLNNWSQGKWQKETDRQENSTKNGHIEDTSIQKQMNSLCPLCAVRRSFCSMGNLSLKYAITSPVNLALMQ